MKIIIQGASLFYNEGAAAMLLSTIEILQDAFSQPEILLAVNNPKLFDRTKKEIQSRCLPVTPFQTESYGEKRLLAGMFLGRFLKKFLQKIFNAPFLQKYQEADLVIDISGDTLSDHYGKSNSWDELLNLIPALCCSSKFIIFPQSIGPYIFQPNRMLAKYIFNNCVSVFPREENTDSILREMGIRTKYKDIINDVAFWLKPISREQLDKIISYENIDTKTPLVGISVSQSFARFRKDGDENFATNYLAAMEKVIGFAVKNYSASVILIPHVTGPLPEEHDDRIACKKLYDLSRFKKNIHLLKGTYNAQEIKGLISLCSLFVGARMHANISALSSCIPTLAISYSHKTQGIMSLLGLKEWVYDDFEIPIEERFSLLVEESPQVIRKLEKKKEEFLLNRNKLIQFIKDV